MTGDEAANGTRPLRVVLWGTYDTGKPRIRLIRAALLTAGIELVEIHADVWEGVEDKSQLRGWGARLGRLARWLAAYPGLLRRYRRAPPHDAVLVGYLGHLDVQVIARAARRRSVPVIWDAFLSLHDTLVSDRRMVGPRHPAARLLHMIEARACRAADRVVLDTEAHAALFRDLYGLASSKTAAVMVGAERSVFSPAPPASRPAEPDRLSVLFYGQFIPLHGIATIVEAACRARERPIDWLIIGEGQESERIRTEIEAGRPGSLRWLPWVPYAELGAQLTRADVCLGIFGETNKAARVIPNKVFQILSAGRPLVTRDSPAIRELVGEGTPGIRLVPPGDADALLTAVEDLGRAPDRFPPEGAALHAALCARFSEAALGAAWRRLLAGAVGHGQRPPGRAATRQTRASP